MRPKVLLWLSASENIPQLKRVLDKLAFALMFSAFLLSGPLSHILFVTAILLALIHLYLNYRTKQ